MLLALASTTQPLRRKAKAKVAVPARVVVDDQHITLRQARQETSITIYCAIGKLAIEIVCDLVYTSGNPVYLEVEG